MERLISRRRFVGSTARGLGAVAVGAASSPRYPPPRPMGRARRAIHISVCGGISHLDTFDPKPDLDSLHGTAMPDAGDLDPFFAKVGLLRRSDWSFRQRGQSGLWVSDLLPCIGGVIDSLTIVRSMVAETANHVPAKFQENTGFRRAGFPSLGAWISFGCGSLANDLPTYVVLPDVRGLPAGGAANWTSGFLPAEHGGVVLAQGETPLPYLFPQREIAPGAESATRRMLARIDASYRASAGERRALEDRERAFALAERMQRTLPGATDLEAESTETRNLYGIDDPDCRDFARSALLARRLTERGVRFVQLFVGGSFGSPRINWDGHEDMVVNHQREARRMDRPLAGLIADLKRRGLLEDTLVICTTEFGRTPYTQADGSTVGRGRDHNVGAFTVWLAGAGFRPGIAYGESDHLGHRVVRDPVTWPDLHASILHAFGIDHRELTYYHDGIERRLTNVHGKVVRGILEPGV